MQRNPYIVYPVGTPLLLPASIVIVPLLINGFYNPLIARIPLLYWTVEAITWIVLPLIALIFALRSTDFVALGLHVRVCNRGGFHFGFALLVLPPLCYAAFQLISGFSQWVFPAKHLPIFFSYRALIPSAGFGRVAVALYFGITAGIVEELYFRAIPFVIAERSGISKTMYAFGTSILFAAAHWEQDFSGIFNAFLGGLLLAGIYVFIRSLWPLIVAHCIVDSVDLCFALGPHQWLRILTNDGGTGR